MSTPGLFARYVGNPILSAADIPYRANTVFNAAAAAIDGESILLMRVEDLRGISHLTVARSDDGRTGWHVDPEPTLMPDPDHHPEEVWGIEDPPDHLVARARGMGGRVHGLQPAGPARVAGHDP